MKRFMLVVGLLACAAAPAAAQFFAFGQNKIQYRDFDWQVLKGPHVDVYYYPAEAHLAPVALDYAEQSYDTLAIQFGHEVTTRIPLIIYASHSDFEQTNILPFIPPEGLLGATDFLKRRVSMPFRGNLSEFRHTLRHEMVHVFQLSWTTENYYRNARNRVRVPLWWTEGLAELWSGGQDARDEMIMRDLTLSGRLPGIQELEFATGGIVYPIGGRIHGWLADTYGDWRVALFYRGMWRYTSFEEAVLGIYGRSLKQLNQEFQLAMRRAYYPAAETLEPLAVEGRTLVELGLKPELANHGDSIPQVYYISPDRGYITILRRTLDGEDTDKIVSAGRSTDFEGFHPFDSRIDASRPGYLLFSSRTAGRDALVIYDLKKREIAGRYQFPELVSVLSPIWEPDGKSVIFSGMATNGLSDLYRVRLPGGELEKLTDDPYQDLDPSLGPDGTRLVFASDRTAGGRDGAINLFILELASGEIAQLTSGPWIDETPRWERNGRIYFASSRDRVLNAFSIDTSGHGRRETSSWTGAFDPTLVPERDALLVGAFHELSWNIYYVPEDSVAQADTFTVEPEPAGTAWVWGSSADTMRYEVTAEPYDRKFTLDFAAGEAVFIPGFGGAQGFQFFLSDLLSDEVLIFGLSSFQGENLGSVFENINGSALYINQKHRLNWGVGLFRLKGAAYQDRLTLSYRETTIGALGLLRYPLNRFERVEGQVVVEHSDRTDFSFPSGASVPSADGLRRVGLLTSTYASYIRDNALWLPSGPIDGSRLRVTAGLTSDFSNARFDSYLLNLDYRHYFRLGDRSAYAIRGIGFYSGGDRPRRINIGGTTALRGYPLFGTIVGSRAVMLNQELRFPLLSHLTFGTPFGDLRFPSVQGAFFGDVGKAWFDDYSDRALIGSYGVSFRLALGPLAVVRFDWGRRWSDNDFQGYALDSDQRKPGFFKVFFGYNY